MRDGRRLTERWFSECAIEAASENQNRERERKKGRDRIPCGSVPPATLSRWPADACRMSYTRFERDVSCDDQSSSRAGRRPSAGRSPSRPRSRPSGGGAVGTAITLGADALPGRVLRDQTFGPRPSGPGGGGRPVGDPRRATLGAVSSSPSFGASSLGASSLGARRGGQSHELKDFDLAIAVAVDLVELTDQPFEFVAIKRPSSLRSKRANPGGNRPAQTEDRPLVDALQGHDRRGHALGTARRPSGRRSPSGPRPSGRRSPSGRSGRRSPSGPRAPRDRAAGHRDDDTFRTLSPRDSARGPSGRRSPSGPRPSGRAVTIRSFGAAIPVGATSLGTRVRAIRTTITFGPRPSGGRPSAAMRAIAMRIELFPDRLPDGSFCQLPSTLLDTGRIPSERFGGGDRTIAIGIQPFEELFATTGTGVPFGATTFTRTTFAQERPIISCMRRRASASRPWSGCPCRGARTTG